MGTIKCRVCNNTWLSVVWNTGSRLARVFCAECGDVYETRVGGFIRLQELVKEYLTQEE